MTTTHSPVHPVLRTGRGPHPWVRRRRLISAVGVAGVADARFPAAPPASVWPACLARDAGCSGPQSPAAGAPGTDLPFASMIEGAQPRVLLGCEDDLLVEKRAS